MPWDANELEGLTEASPFLSTPRQNVVAEHSFEDPLAPSTVFAAREDREAFIPELEEEEVVDALPGYVLEETLRRIDDAEVEAFVPFEPTSAVSPYDRELDGELAYEVEEERDIPDVIGDAIHLGILSAPVAAAIDAGERDEKKLTNMLFFGRHPELPANHKITADEKQLAQEWVHLRDDIIRPAILRKVEGVIVEPPFRAPTPPGFSTDATLQACIKAPHGERIAIVDLTDPAAAVYAGIDDTKTTFAASMAKVAALYAAFELRARVREALKAVPVTVPLPKVLTNLQKAWQPQIDAKKPKDAAAFKGFPKLREIFDITVAAGAWKVEFTSKGDIATLADAENATFAQIEGKFGFRQLIELSARFSNDEASARCITSLSYEYINAVLVNAGLYEAGKGGIWLGAPYPHAVGKDPDRDRHWPAEATTTESNASRRFQVGTPKAFATLFTWLARGTLIDPNPSDLFDILDTGTNDFFKGALGDAGKTVVLSRTKIGVIANSYWCQTSFIRRDKKDHAGNPVQYVLCLMNDKAGWIADKDLIDPLDECILKRHP